MEFNEVCSGSTTHYLPEVVNAVKDYFLLKYYDEENVCKAQSLIFTELRFNEQISK